jgi:hypothetical protein
MIQTNNVIGEIHMKIITLAAAAVALSGFTSLVTAGDVITSSDELGTALSKECAALYPTDAVKFTACMRGKDANDEGGAKKK